MLRPAGKEAARHGCSRAGQAVQLRLQKWLSSDEYVSERGWENATLKDCPAHPQGGCGFARHTPYPRVTPPGIRVARWYCPQAHQTFSLLPTFLSSRLPGLLADVDAVVRTAEAARLQGQSWEEIAADLRPDIGLQGALRWLRRRLALVHASARAIIGLLPDRLAGSAPTLTSIAVRLGVSPVLIALREIAEDSLPRLPPPLGFGPRPASRWHRPRPLQHDSGADPPDHLR